MVLNGVNVTDFYYICIERCKLIGADLYSN